MKVKNWWESTTVWGSLAAIAASLLGLFGIEVDQASLVDILLRAGSLIGGCVALYGRLVSRHPIRKVGG